MTDINRLPDDMLRNIMGRLPAKTFAFASCVSKAWYFVSTQILSHPKLATALSTNPSLIDAVHEVLGKVLCKPIRPHFAIACISEKDGLRLVHQLISETLGAETPLVTHISNGVMGADALTDELKEVQWEYFDYNCPHPRHASNEFGYASRGIVLVVGYLPGIKVDAVPFFHPKWDPRMTMIDHAKFIQEIKAFTASVSDDEYPNAIMIFGDLNSDVNSIVEKLDHAMPKEATAIVGDSGGCFLFNSLNYTITSRYAYTLDAVALVFATDKNKSPDVGSIEFHVAMAGGLIPFGPQFEVLSVGTRPPKKLSWLCVTREGLDLVMDFRAVLNTINEAADGPFSELYIGVTQEGVDYSRGRARSVTSMSFYKVIGGAGFVFFIDGVGVRSGDSFTFYHKDFETAETTNLIAHNNLKILKDNTCADTRNGSNKIGDGELKGVFGGLIFSCHTRGESYFGGSNVDVFPFSRNFPGVPVAGVFCKGEIGRGSSRHIIEHGHQEQCPENSSRHACSAVYMVMSYDPPTSLDQ